MIAIVDTGGANISSIQDAFERLGKRCIVTLDIESLKFASHLVLPGVGHAKTAMDKLCRSEVAQYLIDQTKPTLGICLGMQLLYTGSDEGSAKTLGVVPGQVTLLESRADFMVPHMGWSRLKNIKTSRLLEGLTEKDYFYFVHSFKGEPNDSVVAYANYNHTSIPAVVECKNFFGTQFHPEKSAEAGSKILSNFLNISEANL